MGEALLGIIAWFVRGVLIRAILSVLGFVLCSLLCVVGFPVILVRGIFAKNPVEKMKQSCRDLSDWCGDWQGSIFK